MPTDNQEGSEDMIKLFKSDIEKLNHYEKMSNRERDLCEATGFFRRAWNHSGLRRCCRAIDCGDEPIFQEADTPFDKGD